MTLEEDVCGYCGGTGEICCSSTSYMGCPECRARRVKQNISPLPSMDDSPQVPETSMDTGDSQTAPSKIDAGGNKHDQ